LQHILQSAHAEIRAVGNLLDDGDEAGELIAAAVGQQGGHAGGLHLGVLVVEFDEAGFEVLARERAEARFDCVARV